MPALCMGAGLASVVECVVTPDHSVGITAALYTNADAECIEAAGHILKANACASHSYTALDYCISRLQSRQKIPWLYIAAEQGISSGTHSSVHQHGSSRLRSSKECLCCT